MRNQPMLARLAIAAFTVCGIAACSSSHEDPDVKVQLDETSPAAKPNPCGLVKCADAFHCVAKGKHASCVADPACTTDADCYLYSGFCSGPYACACVAHENSVRIGCSTSQITCTVDPCAGSSAACVNGACARVASP